MASKKTFVGLQAVDIFSTTIGNSMFGVQKYESNPLGIFAYEHGGVLGLLAIKALVLGLYFSGLLLMEALEKNPTDVRKLPLSRKLVVGANYFYGFIAVTNILPLLTHDLSTP